MHIPPERRGQLIEYSYGYYDGALYRRIIWPNQSAEWSVCLDNTTKYQPWNREPRLESSMWCACREPGERPRTPLPRL